MRSIAIWYFQFFYPFTQSLFCTCVKKKFAFGLTTLPLGPTYSFNSSCLQFSNKFILVFTLSFVLPLTSMTVLSMLSKKFFSMCITSRLWCKKLAFQYGNFQMVLFLVQLCFFPKPSSTNSAFSTRVGNYETCCHICSLDKHLLISTCPF